MMWTVLETEDCGIHVVPTDEEHTFINCRCDPEIEPNGLHIHNSFDGREDFETGKREPS